MTNQLPVSGLVIVEDCSIHIERVTSGRNSHPSTRQIEVNAPAPAVPALVFEEEEVITARMPVIQIEEDSIITPDEDDSSSHPVREIKPVGQHVNWRVLAEKPLWMYFAKLRQIHHTYPDNEQVNAVYLAVRKELYDRYLPDVLKVTRSYFTRRMPKFSLLNQEDLEQVAQIEMLKYLDKFDPEYGTITFMQFLNAKGKSRLNGSIKDCLRSLQDFSRLIAKLRRELKPLFIKLTQKIGHKPTSEEFLDEYGWDTSIKVEKNKWMTYREILSHPLFYSGVFNQRQHASIDSEGFNEENLESLANIEAPIPRRDNQVNRYDSMNFILSHIEDEDIRYIIWEYYYNDETDKRIFRSLSAFGKKCSPSWITNKRKAGEKIIEQRLGRKGLEILANRDSE